ncbi:hypothetical protein M405DRAFT_869418 [Rhizopogon salebrosus TDB-379]|nr:hypothetical protein M405DRAFT_869418 [Rhizopogon salebrosus TDB-379]
MPTSCIRAGSASLSQFPTRFSPESPGSSSHTTLASLGSPLPVVADQMFAEEENLDQEMVVLINEGSEVVDSAEEDDLNTDREINEDSEVVDSAEEDDLNTDEEINDDSEVVDSAEEDDLNTDQEINDESEVIDSFFQDSICPEEEMGYDEDGTDIDIIHRQKDRAKRSVATNVRAFKTKAAKPTAMKRCHLYARMDDHGAHPKVHGDGSNHAPFLPAPFDPNCPRNGRPLAAPAAWRVH